MDLRPVNRKNGNGWIWATDQGLMRRFVTAFAYMPSWSQYNPGGEGRKSDHRTGSCMTGSWIGTATEKRSSTPTPSKRNIRARHKKK